MPQAIAKDEPTAGKFETTGGAPNVILVVVDTLRADYTGPYGATHPTTPFLDELAARGVTFTNAFSPAPWTVPAMHSMMTGLYPSEHGVTKGKQGPAAEPVLSQKANTLAEIMGKSGYRTFAVNTNGAIAARFGLGQGFDTFVGEHFAWIPFGNLALEALGRPMKDSPRYFLWLHYFDPHQPYFCRTPWFNEWNQSKFKDETALGTDITKKIYRQNKGMKDGDPVAVEDVPGLFTIINQVTMGRGLQVVFANFRRNPEQLVGEYLKFMEAAYMSDIRATDEDLRQTLGALGMDENTVIVFTSDHGDELKDHGAFGHHTGRLYQELIHVPLVVVLPGGVGAGRVVDTPVSTIDIMPTILDLVGAPVPTDISGVSLKGLLTGEGGKRDGAIYSEISDIAGDVKAIIDFPWKYTMNFRTNHDELFDLSSDPREISNLVSSHKDVAQALRGRLMEWKAATSERWPETNAVPLTDDDITRLRELGYVRD